jgi:hypothetical protein
LPLTVSKTFSASNLLSRSLLPHLGGVLLLQIGGGFVQLRCLFMCGGCAQMCR